MRIEYFGHCFFRVSFGKTSVLFDPFINTDLPGTRMKRLVGCAVKERDVGKSDVAVISSDDFDHFDSKALRFFADRDNCIIIAHDSALDKLEVSPHLKKPVRVNDSFSMRGIDFRVLPAHCPGCFYPLSFIASKDGESVFFPGKTALMDNFSEVRANVAILPIGGGMGMDVVDAVRAVKTIKPDYVIPMHYNTFDSIKANPLDFKARIEKSILKTKPVILKEGSSFRI
ncbi:MAG: MBL fold metallo-hydrolase [Candidatus Diapherotrites archaeon]|nr:MBL fold metallo-hydrolase [Candidatus Diapherotrites archaeon]